MYADNIVIADNAAANKTFVKVSQNSQESVRLDNSTTLAAPRKMTIRHSAGVQGKARELVDRHNVVFSKDRLSSTGNPVTSTVSLAVGIPRDSAASGDVDDLVAFLKNWIGVGANVTSLKLGES